MYNQNIIKFRNTVGTSEMNYILEFLKTTTFMHPSSRERYSEFYFRILADNNVHSSRQPWKRLGRNVITDLYSFINRKHYSPLLFSIQIFLLISHSFRFPNWFILFISLMQIEYSMIKLFVTRPLMFNTRK